MSNYIVRLITPTRSDYCFRLGDLLYLPGAPENQAWKQLLQLYKGKLPFNVDAYDTILPFGYNFAMRLVSDKDYGDTVEYFGRIVDRITWSAALQWLVNQVDVKTSDLKSKSQPNADAKYANAKLCATYTVELALHRK